MDREKCKKCAEQTHTKQGYLRCSLGAYDPKSCNSFREFGAPLAEVETIRRMVSKNNFKESIGSINSYNCGSCNRLTIAVLLETGVTPFMIGCKHCNSHATSMMYPARLQQYTELNVLLAVNAHIVWFRPETEKEASEQSQWGEPEECLSHWRNGGLFKRVPTPEDVETIKKLWERRFHSDTIRRLVRDRPISPGNYRFA